MASAPPLQPTCFNCHSLLYPAPQCPALSFHAHSDEPADGIQVDQAAGMLLNPEDADALAKGIEQVLSNDRLLQRYESKLDEIAVSATQHGGLRRLDLKGKSLTGRLSGPSAA